MIDRLGWRLLSAFCKAFVARRLHLQVEGLEYLPRTGALVIAARHYHHFYDGCILLATVPRPLQIMVGLDWVQDRRVRGLTEALCRVGRWPAVLRQDRQGKAERPTARRNADPPDEGGRYMRQALRMTSALMAERRALLVFPEGYPNIDLFYTPKSGDDDVLPFRNGFAKLVRLAQRSSHRRIAVVPAGFEYRRGPRYSVTLRFGAAEFLERGADVTAFAAAIERQVRLLSGLNAAKPAAIAMAVPAPA
ncbi:MAG: 1-acyl-sn-glycerol-3-phosphate acyltransferase [Chloroflexota bacterium]